MRARRAIAAPDSPAEDGRSEAFDGRTARGTRQPSGASEGEEHAQRATASARVDALRQLGSLPVIREPLRVHPLRDFLHRRGVSLTQAARAFGLSRRTLTAVVTWRARMRAPAERLIAAQLGADPSDLFPALD